MLAHDKPPPPTTELVLTAPRRASARESAGGHWELRSHWDSPAVGRGRRRDRRCSTWRLHPNATRARRGLEGRAIATAVPVSTAASAALDAT